MSERDPTGPKIPIPGAPGAAIYSALMRLAMFCGDATVTIRKERLPQGGYTYQIANHNETVQRS
jgi:hypothetical protein